MSAGTERISIRTTSEEQTIALGMVVADALRAGDVVAIDGELGAGKTRLVRGIARGFGVASGEIRSPTFALAHEYAVASARPRLVHIDAYRLASTEDLDSIGWDRLVGSDSVVVIEWADRVADALPPGRFSVRIDHAGEDTRDIAIACPGGRGVASLRAFSTTVDGGPARTYRCRACGRPIESSAETFPFCSMRCRQADLGGWFNERYRISRDIAEADLDEE